MPILDDQYNSRLNNYITTRFDRYINWYIENTKISRINLFAALVVIVICTLCLLFIPNSVDQMSFLKYSFDPTLAIKLGLLTSIGLAFFSMFTSYKKMKCFLTEKALLQSEYALFRERDVDISELNHEAEFVRFVNAVDCIMAATKPEIAIAVSQDNALKAKVRGASEI
jgi:hypothetical protein